MFNEKERLHQNPSDYGSFISTKSKENHSRPCRNQIIFVLLLISVCAVCIIFAANPTKNRSTQTVHEVNTAQCQTHICLYQISSVGFIPNSQMQLLQNHPSTVASSFAFINQNLFKTTPQTLTITHTDGGTMSMTLKSFKNGGLYYYADALENRFLLNMNSITNNIEGYGSCNGLKYELHSIGDDELYLLIQKNWIQETTNWCGIFDINTKYNQIQNDINIENNDLNDMNEDIAIWLSANNMITSHIGLDGLFINKDISNQPFVVEPLCSDLSIYDGYVYCLYPSGDTWDTFDYLRFYRYSIRDSVWTEMSDVPLNLGDSSINIPHSMVIMEDNEVYAFSVNPTDLMINIYSYTTSWRLHHYMPLINGDIDKVEIDSIYLNDVLYFSSNEYGALETYTLYHYTEDIFSEVSIWSKADVPIYSHCLTQFDDELLMFYVDYGHSLWAYYDDTAYSLDFNIANDIETNKFECVFTQNGNILSWMHGSVIYYLQLSPDDFKQIVLYSTLPWNGDENANIFQLISMQKSINNYKTLSVYYKNDIIHNYLTDFALMSMDISSIVSLSNIIYSINNNYDGMMKLDNILQYNEAVNGFTSYEGESDINILLVDTMSDEKEIGFAQCDDSDQSFAVVKYTVF